MKESVMVKIRHFVGSFFSEQFREKFILFSKKDTRKIILEDFRYKYTIKWYTLWNCINISTEQQDYSHNLKTAVQFHIYYTDLLDEIYEGIKNITSNYDLYISTNTDEKKQIIELFFQNHHIAAQNIIVETIENKGRDVWPLLKQIQPIYKNYDIIIHLHSKKSVNKGLGDEWRKYLYYNILGKKHYTDNIIKYLSNNPQIGIMAPPPLPHKGIYRAYCESKFDFANETTDLLNKIGLKPTKKFNPKKFQFPAGNMFLARTNAIKQIFEHNFKSEDFPSEIGQDDHTIMHTIERIWHYVAKYNGYKYKECKIKDK